MWAIGFFYGRNFFFFVSGWVEKLRGVKGWKVVHIFTCCVFCC